MVQIWSCFQRTFHLVWKKYKYAFEWWDKGSKQGDRNNTDGSLISSRKTDITADTPVEECDY